MRFILATSLLALSAPLAAAAINGQLAPGFTGTDASGRTVRLADFKGKTVVIEWNNPGCPFVQKHYNSGNMQKTQAAARADGAVWLTVNSGAPGQQGHMNGAEATAFLRSTKSTPAAYLIDPKGDIGHLYGARTTPHMYVIDRTGKLVYQGGIDDKPTANPADIKTANNMVLAALGDLKAGRPVARPEARAYGCTVKYAS